MKSLNANTRQNRSLSMDPAENTIMAGMGAMLIFSAANPNKLAPKADRKPIAPISATQVTPCSYSNFVNSVGISS
jgi:hypothetical protein